MRNISTIRELAQAGLTLAFVGAVGTISWARRALRNPALKRSFQVENFLFRAPLSATGFWTRPEVAALLTPPPAPPATATGVTSRISKSSTEAATLER